MISIAPCEMLSSDIGDALKDVPETFAGTVAPAVQATFGIEDPAEF